MKNIGNNIRALRADLDWNQSELARKANLTGSAISMIESGQRVPSLISIRKISEALSVPLAELTGDLIQEDIIAQESQSFIRKFKILDDLSTGDRKLILNLAERLRKS